MPGKQERKLGCPALAFLPGFAKVEVYVDNFSPEGFHHLLAPGPTHLLTARAAGGGRSMHSLRAGHQALHNDHEKGA